MRRLMGRLGARLAGDPARDHDRSEAGEHGSVARNVGKVSFTYRDSGEYGRFINECRVEAWASIVREHALDRTEVVDIGCSYGSWADNYRGLGFRKLFGIDPNPDVIPKARSRFDEVRLGFAADATRYRENAPVVAANGVLVHILEHSAAVGFLRDCARLLSPEGYLIYSVINPDWYLSTGRREWVGDVSCVRPLDTHRRYAREAGLRIVAEVGTFIEPWGVHGLEFLAEDQELRNRRELYEPFVSLASLLRGTTLAMFSELLMVTQRAA